MNTVELYARLRRAVLVEGLKPEGGSPGARAGTQDGGEVVDRGECHTHAGSAR